MRSSTSVSQARSSTPFNFAVAIRLATIAQCRAPPSRLLAKADSTPALYLAYNKSTQLAAQAHFPAHVACRTMHSLAYRAMRMFEQQHRLERKLTGGEVAELLAIPALEPRQPTRPSYGYCSQMFTKPTRCKLPHTFADICQHLTLLAKACFCSLFTA
jgi:hypothetical protein